MSKYFSIEELCKSDTANIQGIDNTPTDEIKENLQELIDNVLDPLREWYGKPIYVNSGYRSPELNKVVNGAKNSFHLKGCAADIDVHDTANNQELFDYIKSNLPFTELGWEAEGAWVHVAYDKTNLKKLIFYA